ncbi:hypothetical protein QQF64_031020 [Cirrhinus molitorella]|uniref:Uncharacterized protein n=1 Tax=Cirrhinus molitorella TaxID=172907 RepID=A0ABR3N541_9TELE
MAVLQVYQAKLLCALDESGPDQSSFKDLFGPAVEGFAERFTAAQKSSQAMRHFLPKRSNSSSAAVSSRPRTAPFTQPPKAAPPPPAVALKAEPRQRSRSARRYPFPKRQGPRPKIALDPAPPASS